MKRPTDKTCVIQTAKSRGGYTRCERLRQGSRSWKRQVGGRLSEGPILGYVMQRNVRLLRLLNTPKRTEIVRFSFQNVLIVVFWFEICVYGFAFSLAVVTPVFFASSAWHWNVKSRQCGDPRSHARVACGSLFYHTCLITGNKMQFSQTIEEQYQPLCSLISKAATVSAQQARKQRQRHHRRRWWTANAYSCSKAKSILMGFRG